MRRLSPYVTRVLLRTPLSADAVTALMIPTGLFAAGVLTLPGVAAGISALLFAQAWLLLDCCDGEVARWRQTFSSRGVFIDGLAHYVTQVALPVAVGIRADGGWDSLGGWTTAGLVVALLVSLLSVESHLVHFVRARAGKPLLDPEVPAPAPRPRTVRGLRRAIAFVPFFRAFNPVELTLLAFIAALVDAAAGDLVGTRILLVALLAAAAVTAIGHLVVILTSDRLD
jgi:phosphatidylglycerophosphate synthase